MFAQMGCLSGTLISRHSTSSEPTEHGLQRGTVACAGARGALPPAPLKEVPLCLPVEQSSLKLDLYSS